MPRRTPFIVFFALASLPGCSANMEAIDDRVSRILQEADRAVGVGFRPDATPSPMSDPRADAYAEQPETFNPEASRLRLERSLTQEADAVIARLESYQAVPEDARPLTLEDALRYAVENSREHRFAAEDFVLAGLRLLQERHRWGPRFFADVSADVTGFPDGRLDDAGNTKAGLFEVALDVVADVGVTQRLPYGGEVSARALARATEQLYERVDGPASQTADIILGANLPLLRGAGVVAREDRIQSERDLIYAARDFARFRREFLFDITRDYLDLIVRLQQIGNAERGVQSFRDLEKQQQSLQAAGRSTPFDTAESQNDTLDAVDRLNSAREQYRLALDRFRVRIGMPLDAPIRLATTAFDLPAPKLTLADSVRAALTYRLDLQTTRDAVEDARRGLRVARNNLLADLDLGATVNIPTDPDRDRGGLQFDGEQIDFGAGITYRAPLDREIERLAVRQAEIGLARSRRAYERTRDTVTIGVRGAVRGIDSARFSLQIQESNVQIAENREASIEADPDRANVRQKTDAIEQTARARDARDSAARDLALAILGYLLESGQLRVGLDGSLDLPEGLRSVDSGQ